MNLTSNDRLIDETEAARLTGYSRYWFQAKRCQGGGPPFMKIEGHTVRYKLSELFAWMDENSTRISDSRNRGRGPKRGLKRTKVGGRVRLRLSK